MIINEILTAPSNNPQEELDEILAKCCELVLDGQESDADFYGMVGACVVFPDGQCIYGVNYEAEDGTRVHAERAALERCADVSPECIVVTTLSPCNRPMDERSGESCEDLIAEYGIEHVYCGYKDPTQDQDASIETENPKLRELCKQLADTFLSETIDPVSGRGAVPPANTIKPEKQIPAKPIEPAVRVDINGHRPDPNATTYKKSVKENFADGRVKGKSRPGRVKRAGASCKGSVTDLRRKAKNASGERARMYHWCANMKGGKKK